MIFATSLAAIGLCTSTFVPQVAGKGVGAGPAASHPGAPRTDKSVPRLLPAEFEKLMKELVPRGAEPWETIPWRSDLLGARDEAIRTRRPLFLWAMNGHPLGCT